MSAELLADMSDDMLTKKSADILSAAEFVGGHVGGQISVSRFVGQQVR